MHNLYNRLNFHGALCPKADSLALCTFPPQMKARIAPCLRHSAVCRQYVCVPLRSAPDVCALACLCVRLPSFIVKKSSRDRLLRKIRYENKQIHITIQQSYDCLYHPSSIHRRIRSAHIQAGLLTSDHHFLCPFSTFTA